MLTRMCKEVAGFGNTTSHGLGVNEIYSKKTPIGARTYDYFHHTDLEQLQKFKLGSNILMMIDADMIDDESSYNSVVDIFSDSHWIVYEGGLQFFDYKGTVANVLKDVKTLTFKIFTWGKSPVTARYKQSNGIETTDLDVAKFINPSVGIKVKSFKSNYYGYIEVS